MNYFDALIDKAIMENKVISICLKRIDFNNRHIGYIKKNKNNALILEELNEIGKVKRQRSILKSEIKSIEFGGEYNDNLEKAYSNALGLSKDRVSYKKAKEVSLIYLSKLKTEKTICSFFFNDGFFSTGILKDFSTDQLYINNIGFNGVEDGFSSFYFKSLTRIRINSRVEIMAKFLHDNNDSNIKNQKKSFTLA